VFFGGGDRRYFSISRAYKPTETSAIQTALRSFHWNTKGEILKERNRKKVERKY
jgi:hypothetical protein